MVPTAMTQVTRKLIESKLLRPILEQRTLTDFHPFVGHVVPSQIKNGKVRCLRDLEILLLLYARHGLRRLEFTEEVLERSLIVENYSRFSLFAITRIEDASLVIEKADLLRADDIRPYSQGYFVDLMDQVRQHARAVVNARHSGVSIPRYVAIAPRSQRPVTDLSNSEETLRIEGGLALTGAPIRLLSHFTRPLISDEQHDANQEHNGEEWSGDEDSAVRSMARRPKADADRPAPLILCKECNHKERRQCDMNKHMKQHSRPFKCPDEACKFHQRGFMGEKERDRHIDEQHNQNPNMFWCDYENCEYYSKRESNLKQHKENKHGWTYHRTRIVTTKANSAIRRQTTQSAKHGGSQIQDSKIILPLTDSDSGSPMEISQSSFSEHEGAHAWPTPEAEMRSLSSGSYRGTPPEVDNDTFLPAFNFGAPIGSVPQDVLADIPPMQSAMPPWQFPTPESGTNDQFSPRTNPVPSPSNSSPHLANRVPFSYGALQNVEGISPASLIYDQQVMHPSFSPTARPGAGDLTFTRTLADEGFGGLSATDDDFWGLDRETSWDRPLFEPAHGQMVASFNVDEELNFDLGGSQPNADVRTDTQYRY